MKTDNTLPPGRRGRQARRRARRRDAAKGVRPRFENRTLRPVDVLTPTTLDEALRLKADHPGAMPIQGGTDLMVALNFDRDRPQTVLNLNEVVELRGWSRVNGALRLGSGLTYAEIEHGELRECCRRSPRRRARSARRRFATAARSAAISAPLRRRGTRSRRCHRRSRGRVRVGARHAPRSGGRVHHRREAKCARARRVDHRRWLSPTARHRRS